MSTEAWLWEELDRSAVVFYDVKRHSDSKSTIFAIASEILKVPKSAHREAEASLNSMAPSRHACFSRLTERA